MSTRRRERVSVDLERNPDIEEKLDLELKIREGTSKLMLAANQPIQILEAAKTLLISNRRMMAYLAELQRRKMHEALAQSTPSPTDSMMPPPSLKDLDLVSRGKVIISHFRLPLCWKQSEFGRDSSKKYAVFCLFRIGTSIFCSSLEHVDTETLDVCFDDVITFEDVSADFECQVEVFAQSHNSEELNGFLKKSNRKHLEALYNFSSGSSSKRSSHLKEDIENMLVGPRYEHVASGILNLSNVSERVQTFDLNLDNNQESSPPTNNFSPARHELCLFGNFCCRIVAQPEYFTKDCFAGGLNILQIQPDAQSPTQANQPQGNYFYSILRNRELSCWSSKKEYDEQKSPKLVIPIDKSTAVEDPSEDDSQFGLTYQTDDDVTHHVIIMKPGATITLWNKALTDHIRSQVQWGKAGRSLMSSPVMFKKSHASVSSTGSRKSTSSHLSYDMITVPELNGFHDTGTTHHAERFNLADPNAVAKMASLGTDEIDKLLMQCKEKSAAEYECDNLDGSPDLHSIPSRTSTEFGTDKSRISNSVNPVGGETDTTDVSGDTLQSAANRVNDILSAADLVESSVDDNADVISTSSISAKSTDKISEGGSEVIDMDATLQASTKAAADIVADLPSSNVDGAAASEVTDRSSVIVDNTGVNDDFPSNLDNEDTHVDAVVDTCEKSNVIENHDVCAIIEHSSANKDDELVAELPIADEMNVHEHVDTDVDTCAANKMNETTETDTHAVAPKTDLSACEVDDFCTDLPKPDSDNNGLVVESNLCAENGIIEADHTCLDARKMVVIETPETTQSAAKANVINDLTASSAPVSTCINIHVHDKTCGDKRTCSAETDCCQSIEGTEELRVQVITAVPDESDFGKSEHADGSNLQIENVTDCRPNISVDLNDSIEQVRTEAGNVLSDYVNGAHSCDLDRDISAVTCSVDGTELIDGDSNVMSTDADSQFVPDAVDLSAISAEFVASDENLSSHFIEPSKCI